MSAGRIVGMATMLLFLACVRAEPEPCGDGRRASGEACDDGNLQNGDGCSSRCELEKPARPSVCGDGVLDPGEACDDGNAESGDGCTASCLVFQGYSCSGSPSRCGPVCGDGIRLTEACEDGNRLDGDGCSAACTVETGWTCDGALAGCASLCGDGVLVGAEGCDDGNTLAGDGCSPTCVAHDFWAPILGASLYERSSHVAFWTGSEMLVWGPESSLAPLGTGFRYAPAAGAPTPMSTRGAPELRWMYVAQWTGAEMFIWGGHDTSGLRNDGYLYRPSTNTWRRVALLGAPRGRVQAASVWTGTEILIFGGEVATSGGNSEDVGEGGRYDVAADAWRPMNVAGGPGPADRVVAAWTGAEMVVFSATDAFAYAPATDTWRNLFLPLPLGEPLWAESIGDEVVILGRARSLRYAPTAGVWSTMAAPPPELLDGSGAFVSTGSEIIGRSSQANSHARYVLALDRWSPIASWSPGRRSPTLVWTGSEVLAWGGLCAVPGDRFSTSCDDGARYDPPADRWTDIVFPRLGRPLRGQSAVWTGEEMLIFGGYIGPGIYSSEGFAFRPGSNTWRVLSSVEAPSPRNEHAAAWTGDAMIVWGGQNNGVELGDGGHYDLASDTWRPLPTLGAPAPRTHMLSAWTGREMIVWGGQGDGPTFFNDGARYDPVAGVWRVLSQENAPAAGSLASRRTGVWTGSQLIVWTSESVNPSRLPDRRRVDWAAYDPQRDSWSRLEPVGAPRGQGYAGVWTGEALIVLGQDQLEPSGGRYDPNTRAWSPIALPDFWRPRTDAHAVWTGREMIVWGGTVQELGANVPTRLEDGARYDPATDRWTPLPNEGRPAGRYEGVALWTGDEMIIWGDGAGGGRFVR